MHRTFDYANRKRILICSCNPGQCHIVKVIAVLTQLKQSYMFRKSFMEYSLLFPVVQQL